MELDGLNLFGPMADASHGTVIKMPVGDFEICRQSFFHHRIAVILRGDQDATRTQIMHRLIGSAMSEFQFEGLGTKGEREDLMSEADTKDWLCLSQLPGGFMSLRQDSRITGAIRKKDAVRIES